MPCWGLHGRLIYLLSVFTCWSTDLLRSFVGCYTLNSKVCQDRACLQDIVDKGNTQAELFLFVLVLFQGLDFVCRNSSSSGLWQFLHGMPNRDPKA